MEPPPLFCARTGAGQHKTRHRAQARAKALAGYDVDASTNLGWSPEKLQPLLAGLADLLPWLKRWHNEFEPEVTSGLGDYFAGFLDEEAMKKGKRERRWRR